jgi:L-iditol 2-dehydrogenase
VRVEERPTPKIGPGELLVKVVASGICGSDVMEWYRIKKAPRVLGHEITGQIVETKSEKFKTGQRVFVSHHVPCNQCKYCREGHPTACATLHQGNYDPGGFSEFIRVPELNVKFGTYLLPENVSYEEGTITEPLGCVIRGQKVIGVKNGQTVLILGSGFAGLLNLRIAKLNGARVAVTDINEYKLKKALELGADEAINAGNDFNLKADRVIVCTGAASAVRQAFKSVERKGVVLFFAVPEGHIEVPSEEFWRNEITLTSSYGAAPDDLAEAISLLKESKIKAKVLITHEVPLDAIQEGFKLVTESKESIKVIVKTG